MNKNISNIKLFFRLFSSIIKTFLLILLISCIIFQLSNKIITPIKINDKADKAEQIQQDLITLIPNLSKSNNYVKEVSFSIKVASEVTNIDDKLLTSIAYYESKMDKNAKSSAGYKGIMQATKHDVYEFAIIDIMRGAKKLEDWIKYRNNNLRYALASYNGGTNPPKQSYDYADKVIKLAKNLKNKRR